VYNVTGHSAWDVIDRGQVYFFTDSVLAQDEERIRFHIQPNRLRHGVTDVYTGNQSGFSKEFPGCRLVVKQGVTFLQIFDKKFSFPSMVDIDYLIVGNNAIRDVQAISSFKCKWLIFDSSNSFYFASRMLREAKNLSLESHSVLHQGAFVTKL
jgi:competence protein ComEC